MLVKTFFDILKMGVDNLLVEDYDGRVVRLTVDFEGVEPCDQSGPSVGIITILLPPVNHQGPP